MDIDLDTAPGEEAEGLGYDSPAGIHDDDDDDDNDDFGGGMDEDLFGKLSKILS